MPSKLTTNNKQQTTKPKVAKVAKASKAPKSNDGAFAVITTGGKQYKVEDGQYLNIEKLQGDHKEGDKITFDKVLLVEGANTKIGTPYVEGAKVEATLEKIGRAQKVIVMKYKQKSRYYKKNGHRQPFFQVKITSIK
jgi:large subunit ribosomal protein L21